MLYIIYYLKCILKLYIYIYHEGNVNNKSAIDFVGRYLFSCSSLGSSPFVFTICILSIVLILSQFHCLEFFDLRFDCSLSRQSFHATCPIEAVTVARVVQDVLQSKRLEDQ
jgi:hypothetical protein